MSAENTNTAIAKQSDLKSMLEHARDSLAQVAPKHLKVDRVIKILLAAASRNPKLLQCSKRSTLNFCMKCSETGLEPIGAGGAWPVPYENRKTGEVEMQFIPDYRGLVNCAKRAKCITSAWAEVVRENDEFDYELGLNPSLTHKPARGDRGELQNAYCIYVLPDGEKHFVVMDADEIKGIRSRSRASQSGPWVTDEGEMWKKTVVRRAMKPFAGMSQELDRAIEADDAALGLHMEVGRQLREPQERTDTAAPDGCGSGPGSPDAGRPAPVPAAAKDTPGNTDAEEREVSESTVDSINEQIKPLYDKLPAKKVNAAMEAAGIRIDEGEEWEMASVEKRTALLSLLKAAK